MQDAQQPNELARYQRQMLLEDFGQAGQEKLRHATVAVIGCGALGTHSAALLTRMGVGRLILIDRDIVEWTNLHRQGLFTEQDARDSLPKTEALCRHLQAINQQVQIETHAADLNHDNAEDLLQDADLLMDGLDNFETRFLLNEYAVREGCAYVYGGAVGMQGMTMGICPRTVAGKSVWEQARFVTPCLRCIFETIPSPGMSPTCDTVGVWPPLVTLIASLQVTEAVKILQARWSAVNRNLLSVDLANNQWRSISVDAFEQAQACPCCADHSFTMLAGRHATRLTRLCGRNAVQYVPAGRSQTIVFEQVAQRLGNVAKVQFNALVLRAWFEDRSRAMDLTLFPDGRAIIKGTEDFTEARSLYQRIVG